MNHFGNQLQAILEAVGLNQRQVALLANLDYPLLNKIIHGKQATTKETLDKLAQVPQLKPFILQEKARRALEDYGAEAIEAAFAEMYQDDPEKLAAMNEQINRRVAEKVQKLSQKLREEQAKQPSQE